VKLVFVLIFFTSQVFGCEEIKAKLMTYENKNIQLRYFITINYSSISNEILFHQDGSYVTSLLNEINSFDKKLAFKEVEILFYKFNDPFEFAAAITKELN